MTVGLLGFGGVGADRAADTALGRDSGAAGGRYSKSIMAALMAVYVGVCVKSFIDARRKRVNA